MGTPILGRALLTVGEDTYCFLAPYGVYTDDIATQTGIQAATADDTFEDDVLVAVKDLIRGGVLLTAKVLVYDSVANVSAYKTLHYSSDKVTTFKTGIKGVTWPVGKNAGQNISGAMTSVRVRSRQ
ncbi:MAG: hypothetical protein V7L30_22690 [Nostoc sp.]|uniref:hypothetical protein n=1 Tax=Nostoc sp. TaxID=1180 RepID=UPI002FF6A7E8